MRAEALPPGADPMLPRPFRVAEARAEMPGVVSLALAPVEGRAPGFAPGQFSMLYAFGAGEAAISISGHPGRADRLVHTVRDAGGTTRALARLGEGETVGLRGPFGRGWPLAEAEGRRLVFVAGGLGLAPLRPAILAACARPERYDGLALVHGARSPETLLYPGTLADWAAGGRLGVTLTVDHAASGWTGRVGVVTTCLDAALAGADPARTAAFVCGPEIMMRFAARALAEAGVPPARIWLSLERNMRCAVGRCGHCQFGADFVCRDGPVLPYDRLAPRLSVREL